MHNNYLTLQMRITETLNPSFLEINDESHLHHSGINEGTHYSIIIVSDNFKQLSRVQRERSLHKLFADIISVNVRLSWRLYTNEEFTQIDKIEPTPKCLGGFHK